MDYDKMKAMMQDNEEADKDKSTTVGKENEDKSTVADRIKAKAKDAVEKGGGQWVGVQAGLPERGIPDHALFDSPKTGSTLALPMDKNLTADVVKAHIEKSDAEFGPVRSIEDYIEELEIRSEKF
jgi:hypothetical protein